MNVQIANPIYDVVFKYLMEDNAIAKLMVSTIIGEEVVELEPKPQEYTIDKEDIDGTGKLLTVYRLDFTAKIKIDEGYKLVLIELQKASVPTDIFRFRSYLGKQYGKKDNSAVTDDGELEPLQIYAIYILGKDLEVCDTPVLRIYPNVIDVATQKVVEVKNKFIEALNHKCWIVQISCLKQRRRNELEQLLSVFDQANSTSDNHILNVREDDFPEKFRAIIRRLKMAAGSPEVKKRMEIEDEHLIYIKNAVRGAHYKGHVEGRQEMKAEMEGIVAETKQALEAERKKNEENTRSIAALSAQLAELQRILKKNQLD